MNDGCTINYNVTSYYNSNIRKNQSITGIRTSTWRKLKNLMEDMRNLTGNRRFSMADTLEMVLNYYTDNHRSGI